jgi:hypothetical protein
MTLLSKGVGRFWKLSISCLKSGWSSLVAARSGCSAGGKNGEGGATLPVLSVNPRGCFRASIIASGALWRLASGIRIHGFKAYGISGSGPGDDPGREGEKFNVRRSFIFTPRSLFSGNGRPVRYAFELSRGRFFQATMSRRGNVEGL